MNISVYVCMCLFCLLVSVWALPPHSFFSPVLLLTPVVKYVYVHFWIFVRKLVMLISHCVLQLYQGDSLRKRWDVFMQMAARMKIGLNRAETRKTLYRYVLNV